MTLANVGRLVGAALLAGALGACGDLHNDELSPRDAAKAEYKCDMESNRIAYGFGGNPFAAGLQYGKCLRAHGFYRK